MKSPDVRAVLIGALVTLAIAVPPAIIAQVQSDRDVLEGSNWVLVLFAVVLVGFMVGGAFAARRAATNALVSGAAAALLAFAVVQGYGIVRRLADGDDIRWVGIVFAAFLAASCGTVGAIVAILRERRSTT